MGRPDPEIRSAIIAHLQKHHTGMCRHWFDDIQPVDLAGGVLKLLIKEPVQLRYLQRCCVQQFTEAAQAVTNRLLAVRFVGEEDAEPEGSPHADPTPNGAAHDAAPLDDDMLLSPDYTFDTFVIGPGNRLAHAAAIAVAERPGRAYNPFFIHGGVGLGKTHLLHAISQSLLRSSPSFRICYVSCSAFMDRFFEAVKAGRMAEFRHRFRNVDVLVIDDIHFLSKRDQTQEEFFHTFNTLYQSGKQIILSSDAAPSEIPDLEERLVSRFNSGLVARIERPCFETRVAILKSKAYIRGMQLPEDVPAYIAARIDTNIRELEGALSKLQVMSLANNAPIDLALAKSALGDDSSAAKPHQPSIQIIIEAVSRYYDVKLTDLLSKRRHKSIALPRQVCMWLARRHTRYSLEEIGGYFGGRDHTTVMHAIRAIDSRCQADTKLHTDVTRLEDQLVAKDTRN
jgi:chromosomal replication initiator protein